MEGTEKLTPEQRQELTADLQQLDAAEKAGNVDLAQAGGYPTPSPAVSTVKLADGRTVTGTPEQISSQIQQAYNTQVQSAQAPPAQNATNQTPTQPVYNYDQFAKQFVDDPGGGLSYLNKSKYGFDPMEVIPTLYQALVDGNTRLQQLESRGIDQSLQELAGFDVTTENRAALDSVIQARGWQPTPASYRDAAIIAQAEGKLAKTSAPTAPTPANPHPNVGGGLQFQSTANGLPTPETGPALVYPQSIGASINGSGVLSDEALTARFAKEAPLEDLHSKIVALETEMRNQPPE